MDSTLIISDKRKDLIVILFLLFIGAAFDKLAETALKDLPLSIPMKHLISILA
jgi:hypothetical protein